MCVMAIEIRNARREDVERIVEMSKRTIDANYRGFLGDEAVDGFIGCGAIEQYTKDHLEQTFVLTVDDEVAGVCVCKVNLIDLVLVDDARHGQGLGSQLLGHCEAKLFEDYDELKLESFEGNGKANGFYESHGWARQGERYYDEKSGVYKVMYVKKR